MLVNWHIELEINYLLIEILIELEKNILLIHFGKIIDFLMKYMCRRY